MACLKCGGTGFLIGGGRCDCGCKDDIILPTTLAVPAQYQSIRFNRLLLPSDLHDSYGIFMEQLIRECTSNVDAFNRNVLICAPPNSGKTVFAFTVFGTLFARGMAMPDVMDLMDARAKLLAIYNVDYEQVELLSRSKLAIIKVPQDLPPKFAETMSMIVERRVMSGGSTIFLFSGSKDDLLAQDKFNKFKALLGDGSYNSIEVKSWERKYDG